MIRLMGDTIGALSLFVLLIGGLFAAHVFEPEPQAQYQGETE